MSYTCKLFYILEISQPPPLANNILNGHVQCHVMAAAMTVQLNDELSLQLLGIQDSQEHSH